MQPDEAIDTGLLCIGSGPAGVAAAMAYREAGGTGRVLVVSDDEEPPYERPPLSKGLLRGEPPGTATPLHDARDYLAHGIELRLADPATALDPMSRTATLRSGAIVAYRACVLASGAGPVRPDVPGAHLPGTHVLRSLSDARALLRAAAGARAAIVIGSGFVGCEAAASLAMRGVAVTLISPEDAPQRSRLGPWAGVRISRWLSEAGVRLELGEKLASLEQRAADLRATTESGKVVTAQVVVLAAGISPRVDLARGAALALHEGRVAVDAHMRTSAPALFAVGDVAYAHNASAGRALAVEHWGDALRMGEVAGHMAAGHDDSWGDVPGFWSTIGDRTLKYAAWGDGWDDAQVTERADQSFAVRYSKQGDLVGVLSFGWDEQYDAASDEIQRAALASVGGAS
jgi:3-phenylpropionate/trans-cinnamate dioxygenase ferredoxin reductase subunit